MVLQWNRREFLKASALGSAMAMTGDFSSLSASDTPRFKTRLYKAFIAEDPTPEICKVYAEAGFQGLEVRNWGAEPAKIKESRKIANDFGLRIHSVMRGGASLNVENEAERKWNIETIKTAIRSAALYGASSILLVPCYIGGIVRKPGELFIPNPKEFKIDYDPTTCVVRSVVEGDNSPYEEYIRVQNRVTELTYQALQDVIPVAAYEGVTIGIENVWNNLWVLPNLYADFVRMFDNRWVKAYLDLGNHAKYADTCDYIRAFGKSELVKLHLKEFRVDPESENTSFEGFVPLGTGTIDWQAVRQTLEEVGYNGWVSYEEEGERNFFTPAEYSRKMDQFFAGQKID